MSRWLLLVLAGSLAAADWPAFRGPERTGISTETGLLKQWPQEGPKLLWRLDDIGSGYATPSVAGSRLFLIANKGMENEFVQALSAADGKTLWTTRLGNVGLPDQEPPYPMARSTPTIEGDVLYALGSDGDLACLDAASGKIRWRKHLVKDFSGKPGRWAYAESPLIDGDVLVATPGGADATLVALNKKTGAVIWKSAVPGGDLAAYSSVIAIHAAGRKQYVQFLDKGVVGVDAKTGQYLWRYDKTSGGPANIATPVYKDGYVYATNSRRFGGGLAQLHATKDGVTAEQVYFERDAPNSLGGQILLGDTLFGTNPRGPVAIEFKTGKVKWQAPEGIGPGAVQYAEGNLYLHAESGDVVLFEASLEAYKEKGRFTPADPPKRTNDRERAWAYPVIANGRMYIRELGSLWCYDVRGR